LAGDEPVGSVAQFEFDPWWNCEQIVCAAALYLLLYQGTTSAVLYQGPASAVPTQTFGNSGL